MAFFVTVKRSHYVFYASLLSSIACVLLVLVTVPIRLTPFVAIIPEYTTWHQVNSIHLMKILWTSQPEGVTPVNECQRHDQPAFHRAEVARRNIKAFSYTSAESVIDALKDAKSRRVLRNFLPLLDIKTKAMLLHTYLVLEKALEKVGVKFLLLHGSLLGVHRFSGIQPWDDDMDIAINASFWPQTRDALSCIDGFELMVDPHMRFAFFSSDATPSNTMTGKKYPFIDIFFHAEDETHVWGLHKVNRRRSLFPKALMFPPSWSYLDGLRVPVPRNIPKILQLQYGDLSVCATQENGHLVPPKDVITVPCSMLYPIYGNFTHS